MKKSMEYIKITGTLTYGGENPAFSSDYRLYEDVTIVDDRGDEIHFHALSFANEMGELLDSRLPGTFYILQSKAGEKTTGVLYAAEVQGKKIFYPSTAVPALKFLGLQASNRFPLIINPWAALLAIVICGGTLSSALSLGGVISPVAAMVLGFGGTGLYLYAPLFYLSKGADLSRMYRILSSDGFITESTDNTRYR